MASITLEELRKTYDKKYWAVNGLSLKIADGELMALLGPSGCGKSSTMRMIAGLEELTSGKIFFNDQLMNRVPPKQRNVAMVFETYALYPTLTVYENLAFPLRSAGWNNEDIKKRVRQIVEIFQVEHLLGHKPRDLSSGQSQLVGLGRALMRQPNVFVMDEPISHLDTRLRSRMRSYIKRLHIDLGYTMLYVTHDQEEAMALADRIAIMDQGIIKQIGTPQDVFYHPNDLFVAGFIGEPPMNFLECQVIHDNGSFHLDVHGHSIPIPTDLKERAQAQSLPDRISIGIRPFYIDVSHTPDEVHTLPAKVFVVEPLGDSTVIGADTDDTRLQISLEAASPLKAGENIWLALDPNYMIGFDPQSTLALVQHTVNPNQGEFSPMDKTAILSRINACGVVAIARVEDASELIPTVEALIKGGVDVFEVTMSVPGAIEVVRDIGKHFGSDVLLGAGTVLDSETARAALLAGAEFLVTPCVTPGVIETARRYGKVVTPGALTPTEILHAWELGGDVIKVFPASRLGPGYIRDVRAPLPQIPLMPTGGITIDNAADYIKAGAVALGMSWLLDKKLMAARQFDQIADNTRRLRDVIEEARR